MTETFIIGGKLHHVSTTPLVDAVNDRRRAIQPVQAPEVNRHRRHYNVPAEKNTELSQTSYIDVNNTKYILFPKKQSLCIVYHIFVNRRSIFKILLLVNSKNATKLALNFLARVKDVGIHYYLVQHYLQNLHQPMHRNVFHSHTNNHFE